MMFGLALPMLLMVSLGAVDIHQASRVKANLQDALDAAALAAARSTHTDPDKIQETGMAALKANMPDYFHSGSGDTASFVLTDNVLEADARVNVKVLVANIVLPPYGKLLDDYLPVSGHSEVLRASRNVEVGIALDITDSMKGTPLTDLKEAANELITIVVQDQQAPFYSKIGLAPYSQGVNLGARAAAARGGVPAGAQISKIEWSTGSSISISSITRATPGVLSASNHKLDNGDVIYLYDIKNNTGLKAGAYVVANKQAGSFQIRKPGETSSVAVSGGSGTITAKAVKCVSNDCGLVITANDHGFSNGDYARLENIGGISQLNSVVRVVRNVTSNSFVIDLPTINLPAYTGGGTAWCMTEGCRFYRFTSNSNNAIAVHEITSCATERVGSNRYTDVAPSTALVGRQYPARASDCPVSEVVPLTSSRPTLTQAVNALAVTGTTAGQTGVAWAWYLVSPRFASFWGGTAAPGEHDPQKTLKVVVLMTDGEFNTQYCRGVVSKDSTAPTSSTYIPHSARINCNASNGNGTNQSLQLCNSMKAEGVIVYTVGFNLSKASGGSTARNLLETCATDKTTHFHDANSGAELKDAFRAIGRDITRLRLAR